MVLVTARHPKDVGQKRWYESSAHLKLALLLSFQLLPQQLLLTQLVSAVPLPNLKDPADQAGLTKRFGNIAVVLSIATACRLYMSGAQMQNWQVTSSAQFTVTSEERPYPACCLLMDCMQYMLNCHVCCCVHNIA